MDSKLKKQATVISDLTKLVVITAISTQKLSGATKDYIQEIGLGRDVDPQHLVDMIFSETSYLEKQLRNLLEKISNEGTVEIIKDAMQG
ncbi:hypothetical protein HN784_03810 [bacterium]|jgi:hypothetical protein|nr:hypothetical protein [bacterium]MBT4251122.1 hypothetical protein [bacterium]MBT4598086.1 hypothetical protein [bacterium]MBT6753428.1 hypothetical protein [bacterium]MBT7038141.1 hypothetical protein [bacterium]